MTAAAPRRRTVLQGALGLAVAGCGAPRAALRIGFLGGLSDRDAHFSREARDGALLAIEQANAAGGVRGRALQLVVQDHGGPLHEAAAARRLIDAQVDAVVGPYTSAVALRLLPLFNAARVLLLSPTLSADSLMRRADYLVCLNSSTRESAQALAQLLLARRWRSLTVLRDMRNAEATRPWSEAFAQVFAAGGGTVAQQVDFGADGPPVFGDLAQRALAVPVDGLLLLASSADTARLAQQVAQRARGLPLASTSWAANPDLIELGGRSVEGLVLVQAFDEADRSPRYRALHADYLARFGLAPSFAAASSFDAVMVLAAALQRAAPGESVRDAVLRHGPYQGVQQLLTIDRFGDTRRAVVASIVRNGRFAPL
ncbi:ABC transporter substrate-binding protein [Pseudorhodoferax sp. Leaf267]|uniref:ABC transporter substrate-binding protein n=1 Tax=Pseudorhodoferax sp. Leaf267 TaxID=1736316 RepID=UPI000700AEAA|nr:ABC transporter substrate-binding protein [Pseudorhodoferax sp. Leaf267]KQP17660.1 hypothetical protein ASF43_07160 [Pseudorhodoferax sp. Leaf267]